MSLDNIRVNLNQNLWFLLISLMALGGAEYYRLCTLYWFGLVLTSIATISFTITLIAYTYRYVTLKTRKENKKLDQI